MPTFNLYKKFQNNTFWRCSKQIQRYMELNIIFVLSVIKIVILLNKHYRIRYIQILIVLSNANYFIGKHPITIAKEICLYFDDPFLVSINIFLRHTFSVKFILAHLSLIGCPTEELERNQYQSSRRILTYKVLDFMYCQWRCH